ncbi:hypothetical protein ACI65C_012799 [Semiaphis heraclei]
MITNYTLLNHWQLRCVNHYSMQCRGRGSINLDDTDFRMTRPHTCVPRPSINNDENDNRTSLLITLRQRATREQTNLRGDSKWNSEERSPLSEGLKNQEIKKQYKNKLKETFRLIERSNNVDDLWNEIEKLSFVSSPNLRN